MTIIKKEGPSEYFRRAGSIIGAALTGLNEPASEDIANPFSGQQIGTLPMENRTEPKAVEPSAPVPAIQLTPEDIKAKVTKAAKDTKLDPKLFHAVVSTESNYNPSAVSPVGAVGLTQLMPKTAAGMGVNPMNVDENLKGGGQYLQSLIKKYDGNVAKALAAYNAGPGRVDKGGPLPQETQDYVAKVLLKAAKEDDIVRPIKREPPKSPPVIKNEPKKDWVKAIIDTMLFPYGRRTND
jgi:soluble lytic murein transglycosylase-like protein